MTAFISPLISVVVPIYNGMPFIIETIESVRRQTYPLWELILCDNVSIDETVATMEHYLADKPDGRIRLHRHAPHLSMAESWNRSLADAKGEFVKLLPSDDILLPSCLETQARLLQDNPDVGFVSSGKEIIDSSGRKYMERNPLREGKYSWDDLGQRLVRAVVNLVGEPAGIMFRRQLLEACGPFNDHYKYFIDVEMYLRFLEKSNLYISNPPLYQFRTHANSASSTSRKISVQEYRYLLDAYGDVLKLSGRPLLKAYLERKAYVVALLRSIVMQSRNHSV